MFVQYVLNCSRIICPFSSYTDSYGTSMVPGNDPHSVSRYVHLATHRLHYFLVIQTAMVPIGYPGPIHSPGLHLDMYTATALLSSIVGVVNIVLLIVVFKEHTVPDEVLVPSIQGSGKLFGNKIDIAKRICTLSLDVF